MDADQLYLASLNARKASETLPVLHRTYTALKRHGQPGIFSNFETTDPDEILVGEDGTIYRDRVLAKVLNGSIWDVRDVGQATVKDICKWLEKTEPNP